MIKRQMSEWLGRVAREYAVLSIMGPRQSGKTTLARTVFKDYDYVNLEDPDVRRMAEADGADFMRRHPAPLILDEVQRVPELLSRIQVLVDANPKRKAAYVLTGSHQPVDLYEIKSSMSFQGSFAENVARLSKIIPETRHQTVVYSGAAARSAGVDFVNYANVKAYVGLQPA